MAHAQDGNEEVYLASVEGNKADLIDTPLLRAEEAMSREGNGMYSETHTYYYLTTIKGTVTFHWFGTSNGSFDETIDLNFAEGTTSNGSSTKL